MKDLNHIDITLLYRKMAGEALSEKEEQAFETWLKKKAHQEYYHNLRVQHEKNLSGERSQIDVQKGWLAVKKKHRKVPLLRKWQFGLQIAAVFVIAFGIGIIWMQREDHTPIVQQAKLLSPAREVTLHLSSGEKVTLDSKSSRELISKDSVSIRMNQGVLQYDTNHLHAEKPTYNELEIPPAGEYILILSDGTKVHLNSQTKLRYPTTFTGEERRVELRGEAYFVVTKSTKPFIVETQGEEIKVFGTEFNVSDYTEKKNQTTLVKGSIGIREKANEKVDFQKIQPGEQFRFNEKSGKYEIQKVNVSHYIAWRDGILAIENESFEIVLQKLERWFGITIENQSGKVFTQTFSGKFQRKDIDLAMKVISFNLGLQYVIEGDHVILRK